MSRVMGYMFQNYRMFAYIVNVNRWRDNLQRLFLRSRTTENLKGGMAVPYVLRTAVINLLCCHYTNIQNSM